MIKVWSRFIATGTHYISSRQSSKIFFFYNKKKKGGMQAQEKHLSCTRLTNCIERCPTFEGWEVPGPGRLQCVICWQLGLTGPVMAEIQREREKGERERGVRQTDTHRACLCRVWHERGQVDTRTKHCGSLLVPVPAAACMEWASPLQEQTLISHSCI